MDGLPLPLFPALGHTAPGEGSQGGGLGHPPSDPPFPPTSSPGLGPRLLPVAAGRPGSALGLGFPRTESPTAPRVEAITTRRVASCPHGCSQQAAEVAAPERAGGHGGVLGRGPQRHIPARPLVPLCGAGDAAAPRDGAGRGSCPQLLAAAPSHTPPTRQPGLTPLPLLFPPQAPVPPSVPSALLFSASEGGLFSVPPGLLCLVPAPLRCCFLGLCPPSPQQALLWLPYLFSPMTGSWR